MAGHDPLEFEAPGPMIIPPTRGTYCGICQMSLTLENETGFLYYRSHSYSPGTADPSTPRIYNALPLPAWTCFYRVLIKTLKRDRRPKWYISGVGRYHFWDSEERARRMQSAHATNRDPVFTVPKAREEWFTDTSQLENQDAVGEKKRKKVAGKRTCVYPSSFHDNAYWTDYPHGWPFHAHCWTIAEKVLGPKLEDNLELLIAAIRSKWEDEQLLNEAVRMAAWVRESSSEADEIRVWNSLVASSDPLAGRDVVELLCESHNQQQISSIDPRCSVATAGNGKHITTVPHDIQTMVLDCIHYTSVRVALAATGWHIDDTYWRGRMPRHIMWELNEVDHNAQIDWKYLCLKAEEMVDSSPGLLNRQRIRNLVMDIERRMEYQAIIGVDETIMDPAPVAEPDN